MDITQQEWKKINTMNLGSVFYTLWRACLANPSPDQVYVKLRKVDDG